MTQTRTCGSSGGLTKTGEPCAQGLNLSPLNGLCLQHDPDRAVEALQVVQGAGRASGVSRREARHAAPEDVPPVAKTLEDAVEWAAWAMHATACGRIDDSVGRTISTLVNSFKSAVEKRDLLREIENLRAQVDTLRKPRKRPRAI